MRYEVRGSKYRTGKGRLPRQARAQKLVPHTSYLVPRTSYLYLGVLVALALLIAAQAVHRAAEADALRRAPTSLPPHAARPPLGAG